MLLLSSADFFFSKLTFSKKSFRNTTRGSNGLDTEQDQLSVGSDLDPSCLQRHKLPQVRMALQSCNRQHFQILLLLRK